MSRIFGKLNPFSGLARRSLVMKRRRPAYHPSVDGLEQRALLTTLNVSGKANIYGPALASPPAPGGGGGGVLPTLVNLSALGNPTTVDFPTVTGTVSGFAAQGGYNGPDGGTHWGGVTNVPAWKGISGIYDGNATMFLVGVFLGPNGQPATAPPTPNVSLANIKASFSPLLGQQFFIGDGRTSSQVLQQFTVPAGATRLFLGFAENLGFGNPNRLPGYYSDNGGSLTVDVEPSTLSPTVYQNTTNATGGGYLFPSYWLTSTDLATNININALTLAPGSAGLPITSLSVIAHNFNATTVKARPTMYVWAADGAGGKPDTLLGDFTLPIATLGNGANTLLSFAVPNGSLIVPNNMTIWVGLGFDNDNGVTPVTAAQLSDVGAPTYHSATIGTDGPQAYAIPPNASITNPAVVPFGPQFGANFGWTVSAAITGNLTAYRPFESDESGINQFNYSIPTSEKLADGVGIRIDSQANGGYTIPGQIDPDLLRVDATVTNTAPVGYHYAFQAANPNLEVWGDQTKSVPILTKSGPGTFSFTSSSKTFWVEWVGASQGTDVLSLLLINNATGTATTLDTVNFHTFSSDLILFTGERFSSGSTEDLGGMLTIDTYLYLHGYDTQLYYPSDETLAYNEARDAALHRGVTRFAILGHSHGGGATNDVASALFNSLPVFKTGKAVVAFAGYIDAINNTTIVDPLPVTTLPVGAKYTLNIYQNNSLPPHGVSINGADNRNVSSYGVDHHTIATNTAVQALIENQLVARIGK